MLVHAIQYSRAIDPSTSHAAGPILLCFAKRRPWHIDDLLLSQTGDILVSLQNQSA